jgi:Ice-binding-like/Domain of unknown function DUF11
MKTFGRSQSVPLLLTLFLVVMMAAPATGMAAQPPVNLGTTASFAVLGGQTVTNTGASVLTGDLGVSPGSSITGFPPGIVNAPYAIHANDGVANQAQLDLTTAFNDAAGRTPFTDLSGQDLGGMTLKRGIYRFSSSAQLTGTLTLDAEGDPDAVFVFQIGTTLTTASNAVVRPINGARFCRVFWKVDSATLGTGTTFLGHILALTTITANTGASVQGQLMARNGAVNLDTNVITNDICLTLRPLRITKTASPTSLSGPGNVTYTYTVSNYGAEPLSGVVVVDDKLGTLTRTSGDTNSDNILQASETWIYTVTTTLSASTTNVATVTGNLPSGAPVTGTATVTVPVRTVAGGRIPNTATPWYNILLVGVALTLIGAAGWWTATRKSRA